MIQVDKKWFVKADTNCFQLCNIKKGTDKEGNETETSVNGTYYLTLEGALQGYVDVKIREKVSEKNLQTIQDLRNYVKKLKESLQKILD